MIFYKKDITKDHAIDSIIPDIFMELPIEKGIMINETDVTCVFSVVLPPHPRKLNFLELVYYKKITNNILESAVFYGRTPTHVYIFKGNPFNIEEVRKKLLKL